MGKTKIVNSPSLESFINAGLERKLKYYKKGVNVEEELTKEHIPIESLPSEFLWMHVKGSTKLSNVVEFAKNALDKGEHRDVVWTATGGGVIKAISCAEILKRSYPVHQVTRLCYRKVNEYWQPQIDGLEEIVASRQIPCIHIWQSLDVISKDTLGYQNGSSKTDFYVEKPPRRDHRPKSGQPKGPGMRNNNKKFKQTNK